MEIVKKVRLRKIIKALRDNPSIMCSSDIYAAARDWGLNVHEAEEVVGNIDGDMKISMVCSSFFRAGYNRALFAVEQEAEYQAGKEMLSERKRRAKELMDLLPDGEIKHKMEDEVFWGLELFEDAGI